MTTPTPATSTKKRSNAVITMAHEATILTFTILGAGSVKLDMAGLHEDVLQRAAIHGLKQRISDAAAIPCDEETGLPATPLEKYEAIKALVDHYNTGTAEWARTRAAGEGTARVGKVLTAMSRAYGWDDEAKARSYVEATATKRGITYAQAIAIWKTSDKIVAELAKMASEAPSKVNADSLLDDLV